MAACKYCPSEGVLITQGGDWVCEPCALSEDVQQCGICQEFDYADYLWMPEDGVDAPICVGCWSREDHDARNH